MAILKILEYPDPFLAQKTRPVEQIDKKILKLIKDMAETMFEGWKLKVRNQPRKKM
jgi:peptide deformylase